MSAKDRIDCINEITWVPMDLSCHISNQIRIYRYTCIGNDNILIIHISNDRKFDKLSYDVSYVSVDQIFPKVLYYFVSDHRPLGQ